MGCYTYVTGKLPLSIAVSDLNPGINTLEIVLSDAAGDTATYSANITVEAVPGALIACNNKGWSPR